MSYDTGMRTFADLTPDIPLKPESIRPYCLWRLALLFAFVAGVAFVIMITVFPDAYKYFDFRSPSGAANTIANPRFSDGTPVSDGMIPDDRTMIGNASASGDFSKITFSFRGEDGSVAPAGTVSAIRAYRSFLLPDGAPIPFRDGTLLSSDRRYFLVSESTLRPFPSEADVRARGYDPDRFLPVGQDTVAVIGAVIPAEETLPDGSVVSYDGDRYMIRNGEAVSFSSERAFRSRYREEDALPIDTATFSTLSVSDARIGFLDGTLVSYGEAVYAVEGATLRPIDSPETFLAKGYVWESVLPITGEEFGIYERGRLYTEQQPHPDGTVFLETTTGRMFLVDGTTKREIPEAVRSQFSTVTAVPAQQVALGECPLHGTPSHSGCELSWNPTETEVGAEYQISFVPDHAVTLRDMRFLFTREMNRRNLDRFIRETVQKIRVRSPLSR